VCEKASFQSTRKKRKGKQSRVEQSEEEERRSECIPSYRPTQRREGLVGWKSIDITPLSVSKVYSG
jgi:hypothetical protein